MIDLLRHLVVEHIIDEVDHTARTGSDNDIGIGRFDTCHLLCSYLLG